LEKVIEYQVLSQENHNEIKEKWSLKTISLTNSQQEEQFRAQNGGGSRGFLGVWGGKTRPKKPEH